MSSPMLLSLLLILILLVAGLTAKRAPSTVAPLRRGKGKGNGHSKVKGRKAVVPVRQSLAKRAAQTVENLKSRAWKTQQSALSSTNRLRRELKSMFSSDFEVLLLRLTKPSDTRPAEADLDRFLNTVEDFVRDLDTSNPTNPYRVTLHKIWTKAAESNGLTSLKALYLLHMLLRYTEPEDGMIFKKILLKMMREPYAPSTGTATKYWDAAAIAHTGAETRHLADFIARYTTYLIKRGRTFTASFEEMKLIAAGMRPEDVTAQLLKAIKILDAALLCRTSADEECEVTMCCLELLARDVRELFLLFHTKLRFVVKEEATGDLFQDWNESEVRAILQHFKSFYNDRFDEIQSFLVDTAEVLSMYKIEIPVVLNTPAIFDERASTNGAAGGAGAASFKDHATLDGDKSASSFDLEALESAPRRDGGQMYSDLGAISDAGAQRVGDLGGADAYIEDDSAETWELPPQRERKPKPKP